MNLAVFERKSDPLSQRYYRQNVIKELLTLGVKVMTFSEKETISAEAELVWDTGLTGYTGPHPIFKRNTKPLVATIHGAASYYLSWQDIYPTHLKALKGYFRKSKIMFDWRWFRSKLAMAITVSEFAMQQVCDVYKLPKNMISSIYHGVDHTIFNINGDRINSKRPYFLQVAQTPYGNRKNVDRILAAYSKLPIDIRPDIVMILAGYRGNNVDINGVRIITETKAHSELAMWYRGALGFVFPSIHETFGLPILEAMSCGCPVITSNVTACPEIADGAALLVDPKSVDDISRAMLRIIEDKNLREVLCKKGLDRARQFSWSISTKKHLEIFEKILSRKM
jgi:glycosyltransferase involved in cell wall biosynthesis